MKISAVSEIKPLYQGNTVNWPIPLDQSSQSPGTCCLYTFLALNQWFSETVYVWWERAPPSPHHSNLNCWGQSGREVGNLSLPLLAKSQPASWVPYTKTWNWNLRSKCEEFMVNALKQKNDLYTGNCTGQTCLEQYAINSTSYHFWCFVIITMN